MQPAWISVVLSCVLAVISLTMAIALLRFKSDHQETQVKEVKAEIKELKEDLSDFKEEIRKELSALSTAVKLTSTEQGAVNKIITDGMAAVMRAVEKVETRVHELEIFDVKSN